MKKTDQEFLLIAQTAVGGILVNLSTFVMALATMGAGAWLQSGAMEWTGAVMFWIALLARSEALRSKSRCFDSPQKLADHLRRKYGVIAKVED